MFLSLLMNASNSTQNSSSFILLLHPHSFNCYLSLQNLAGMEQKSFHCCLTCFSLAVISNTLHTVVTLPLLLPEPANNIGTEMNNNTNLQRFELVCSTSTRFTKQNVLMFHFIYHTSDIVFHFI